ncbi:MAG: methylenetetrahydrofolate reductase, partial [Actinomycetota bacterium]
MFIRDCFQSGRPVFSFEFFPPKTEEGLKNLYGTIEELAPLKPSFVSVTYGAGGTTRDLTVDLTSRIKREIGLEAMAHLTCVGHSADEIAAVVDRLREGGIENILA